MTLPRIVERPAFQVAGKKTWISGQDNALFGRFWAQCKTDGLFDTFARLTGFQAGPQTGGATLGISRVEQDPSNRAFFFMIAVELPVGRDAGDLECYTMPASQWAVFECRGSIPAALVESEIYAFTQWLPSSGCTHALAPEMEVYPPQGNANDGEDYCEFWLPITGTKS